MKVLFAFVLALSSVSSLGSGPYLPSGWRPSGQAFFLPSEVRTAPEPIVSTLEPKTPEATVLPSESTSSEDKIPESSVTPSQLTSVEEKIPESTVTSTESSTSEDRTTDSATPSVEQVQDVIQENEASGSDFLREYGPPAVLDIHQSITVQGLPDIVTDHTFRVDDAKNSQDEPVSLTSVEVVTAAVIASDAPEKEKVSVETVTVVEPKSNEEIVIVQTDAIVEAKSSQYASTTEAIIGEEISEVTTAKFEETIAEEETSTPSQSATEGTEKVEDNSVLPVKSINTEAQVTESNSLEYLPPVSKEELSQDSDVIAKEDAVESEVPSTLSKRREDSAVVVKTEINQSEDKTEESSGLEQVSEVLCEQKRVGFSEYGPPKSDTDEKSEAERIENNETRRRRFSSRFASFNKH